jgi:sigma-B regulation protein RsbU (phosphoserine phosphatase)
MPHDLDKTAYLLQCLMDSVSDMIYFKDRDSRFIMVNKALAEWQGGCGPDELIGKSDMDTYTEADAERMRADELRIMKTGEPLLGLEEHETWKEGAHAWVSTTKMPLRNEAGDIIGIFGISRDITEHKEAELRAARYAKEVKRYAKEVRRIKEELEDDLRMAGELQKTFFPVTYPVFPEGVPPGKSRVHFHHYHHVAGGLVGGDLCSIHKISETEAGIFLCDVMGHGVRAALGTAIIRAIVDEISRTELDPGRYLESMNKALMPILHTDDEIVYATACYMVLDLQTGRVRLANAGHPAPVCLSGDEKRAEWYMENPDLRGPALAIMHGARYPTVERRIHPGDAVVMFTDGIYEVAGADREEYGEQRLLETFQRHNDLSLHDLFPLILDDARRFAGDASFDDDVCLVGFRLNGMLRSGER